MKHDQQKLLRSLAAGTVAAGALLAPATALAGHEHVQKTITKGLDPHVFTGEADVSNVGGGQEHWEEFWSGEGSLRGPTAGLAVCNYQGGWKIQNPDGSYLRTNYTAFHGGCSYSGWYHSSATTGNYAENKRFTALWKSDQTNGSYTAIGSLSD